ncbi:MAG: DDE-type integrase/transposase/recombinase, partial [Candidatus Omnitrophica bacterium]|nr:DDE-type integrase/transposase/recombinase [Candidatus Omnitrophota bacterium]
MLALQDFKFSIVHIAGKSNYADVLSRLPVDSEISDECRNTEDFAYSAVCEALPSAIKPSILESETQKDPILKKVESCILSNDWSSMKSTPFWHVKSELWLYRHLILRGDRIVIPKSLRTSVLKLAHEGHQGIVRTKARLRNKVWWPGVDSDAEKLVQGCYPCQLVGAHPRPEPLKTTKLPEGPWFDVATDLLDVGGGQHVLVITDYYSRWPEVIALRKTDAPHVTKCLEAVFQTHGIPYTLRSDNGPPFNSGQFEAFLDYLGIEHKRS